MRTDTKPPRSSERRAAHAAYERHRTRMIAYGRWQPHVDAEPVRAHVRGLMADGLSRRRITEISGVSETTVIRLLYGQPGRSPSKVIRTESARALIAVRADLDMLGPTALVDATGTRRRLQALIAQGWSRARIAERLNTHPDVISRYTRRARVTAAVVRAVRALYEDLWDVKPPEDGDAAAARRHAAANGWLPPLAWDDETIDDPGAGPAHGQDSGIDEIAVERALAGDTVPLTPAEITEVVRIGTERAMSVRRLAEITGRTERSIQRRRSA